MKRVVFAVIGLTVAAYFSVQWGHSSSSPSVALPAETLELVRHTEYPTYYAHVNGVRIAYQEFGKPQDDAVLLVMGLGGQLIHWEDSFVFSLVEQGYRVIRFDNRDSGWSSKFHQQGAPGAFTLLKYKLGLPLGAPYRLDDMADDAIALLDHLGIEQAHIAGISMGGMIAQLMAAHHPERVTTLTSIMSTSSDPDLPSGTLQPSLENLDGMSRTEVIVSRAQFAQQIDGDVAELSTQAWQQRMTRSYDRAHYPDGTARQLWAIADSGDRVDLLKQIKLPTLVVHGTADNLIPLQAGQHTAELITDSKFVALEGMGHFIDSQNEPLLIDEMLDLYAQHSVVKQPESHAAPAVLSMR
ncbi:alpha/beta hydrolase [Arenicella chitinivorans]|uniref:Alpha/beta hydrolase n=1 Tax=Arenicella chitinivorans TaxID=1329800 RepID=A0A918VFW4_9GAMM|nr:alpha/beta hydrolase [Arenicella chitinivorans]GGZ97883.1 alpha/beta hydrolase [Arenicella chitinivorans]